jgi:hypothetical protein
MKYDGIAKKYDEVLGAAIIIDHELLICDIVNSKKYKYFVNGKPVANTELFRFDPKTSKLSYIEGTMYEAVKEYYFRDAKISKELYDIAKLENHDVHEQISMSYSFPDIEPIEITPYIIGYVNSANQYYQDKLVLLKKPTYLNTNGAIIKIRSMVADINDEINHELFNVWSHKGFRYVNDVSKFKDEVKQLFISRIAELEKSAKNHMICAYDLLKIMNEDEILLEELGEALGIPDCDIGLDDEILEIVEKYQG